MNSFFHIKRFLFNKALRILLLTDGVVLFSAAMLGPIYALYVEKVGGDLLNASMAGGVFALAAGITVLVSGRFSDRIKRDELIVVAGYIVIGIGFLLYTLVSSVWWLLAVQALIGFGEAIYVPAYDALYTRHLDHKKTGTEWGAWEGMKYFATAIGALAGGFLVTKFGFNTLFVTMAGFCFISAVYVLHLPKKTL